MALRQIPFLCMVKSTYCPYNRTCQDTLPSKSSADILLSNSNVEDDNGLPHIIDEGDACCVLSTEVEGSAKAGSWAEDPGLILELGGSSTESFKVAEFVQ